MASSHETFFACLRAAETEEGVRLQCRVLPPTHPEESLAAERSFLRSASFLVRLLVLTALFSTAAVYECAHLTALTSSEVWVHLRTGVWILLNHSVPRSGLFSRYSNLPWNDSNWGFDVLLGLAYRLLGLRAIPISLMVLKVAMAAVTFLLARSSRANFWGAVLLSAAAQYLIPNLQPLPYVLSIIFFAIELRLLFDCRRTGETRNLLWLPMLFLLWANLHLQFVAGLILLALFLIAVLIEGSLRARGVRWLSDQVRPLDPQPVAIVSFLSLLATFANPYMVHLLPSAFKNLYSTVGFEHFTEMSSMTFRRPQEYALMLLVMMAYLALGRRRSLALFELMALLAGTLVAFRVARDGWMVVLPAVAVLSFGFGFARAEPEVVDRKSLTRERAGIVATTAAALAIAAALVPSSKALMDKISAKFPVKACEYIVVNHLPQPLFNAYEWGSFVTWYLQQYPVAVDSRVDLYGSDILAAYFDVVTGKELMESQPMLTSAGTLLLEKQYAMSKALTELPALRAQYRLVYSDEIASVFVPQTQVPQTLVPQAKP